MWVCLKGVAYVGKPSLRMSYVREVPSALFWAFPTVTGRSVIQTRKKTSATCMQDFHFYSFVMYLKL